MLRRRELLGLGVAAVSVTAARKLAAATHEDGPLDALGVHAGAQFGGCSVRAVDRLADGAVRVSMVGAGGPFYVEVLAHDPRFPAVASAGSVAVYVLNDGAGRTRTVEEHGLAAMELASHLARAAAAGGRLPALPSMGDRSSRGTGRART